MLAGQTETKEKPANTHRHDVFASAIIGQIMREQHELPLVHEQEIAAIHAPASAPLLENPAPKMIGEQSRPLNTELEQSIVDVDHAVMAVVPPLKSKTAVPLIEKPPVHTRVKDQPASVVMASKSVVDAADEPKNLLRKFTITPAVEGLPDAPQPHAEQAEIFHDTNQRKIPILAEQATASIEIPRSTIVADSTAPVGPEVSRITVLPEADETGLSYEMPPTNATKIIEYISDRREITAAVEEQAETFVATLPERVQESYLTYIDRPETTLEQTEAVMELTITIAAVADRLHVLWQDGRDTSEEALMIEAVLAEQYTQLLTTIGMEVSEETIRTFIEMIHSDTYGYEAVQLAKIDYQQKWEKDHWLALVNDQNDDASILKRWLNAGRAVVKNIVILAR